MDRIVLSVVLNVGATTDEDVYLTVPPGEWEIEAIYLVPNSTVATDATDYRTTTYKVGSSTVASQTTNSSGGSARTVATPQTLTLTTPSAFPVTGGSDYILVSSAKTGGSGKVEDATHQVVLRKVRG
jgi:hypothetical protein